MSVKVIDASAFACIIFQEAEDLAMRERLRGHQLHAPGLLRFEMTNVCVKKARRAPLSRDGISEQHKISLSIPIEEHAVDHVETARLALDFGLSAYDASYLWLARHLGVELVTLDGALQKAAAKP